MQEVEPVSEETSALTAPLVKEKKKMGKGKIIAALVIIALIIVGVALLIVTSPRELVINEGNDVEVNVGDEIEIPISGEGLTEEELQNVNWSALDEKVITIENGVMKVSYDKNAFNGSREDAEEFDEIESDEETDNNTFTSTIFADYKKGIKKWEGIADVTVSLKPVDFENGEIIKEPKASRDSYIEITAADDHNTYFYFKSTTNPDNDISFLVKKGKKATVPVPCDTYVFYEANGDTWYGSEILFGPDTYYMKNEGEYEFTTSNYWTLAMEADDGNLATSDILSEDFPE